MTIIQQYGLNGLRTARSGCGSRSCCSRCSRSTRCALTKQPETIADDHRPCHGTDADLCVILRGELLNVRRVFALPFRAAILEPDFDLRFGETELFGERRALRNRQIFAAFEFAFECFDLGCREGGPRTFLAIVSAVGCLGAGKESYSIIHTQHQGDN